MASELDISRAAAAIYAESLLQLANEQNQAEVIGDELAGLVELWRREPSFAAMMSSAAIDSDARRESLRRIFSGKLSKLTLNLLLVLNDNRRPNILPAVCEAYRKKLGDQLGRKSVHVTTAVALDPGRRQRLIDVMRKLSGHEPVLFERVDPDLLGGMMVQIGDRLYDTSLRRRLRNLRSALFASTERHMLAGGARFMTH